MNKRDIAYQLSEYSRWEIFSIIRATMRLKKYHKLYDKITKDLETLDEMVEELENE